MSTKKPIVVNNGESEQLQTGDSLLLGLVEIEIDFGAAPLSSKTFTITDAGVITTNKILIYTSPKPGTGRVGNDWEVEMPFFTAKAGVGNFLLSVVFPHLVVGKRNIYYLLT